MSDNPRAIDEKARELVPGLRSVWVVDPGAHVPDGVEHVHPGTPEYFDVLARAKFFVNNVNFPNHLVKRPGQVHVMTHHGTPLKRMGLDLRDTQIAGKRMDFDALLRRCARWDFSVSSNRLSTLTWERVYPCRARRSRSATRATTVWRTPRRRTSPPPARSSASTTAASPSCTRPRTASTATATSRRWTSPPSPTASAPATCCSPACTTSMVPTPSCAACTTRGASATSAGIPRSRR